jgi:hypothetical protein
MRARLFAGAHNGFGEPQAGSPGPDTPMTVTASGAEGAS